MSWLFSRALVQEYLAPHHLDLERSALSSWIGTADAFLHGDKMTDRLDPFSLYGMTFVPLTAERGAADVISCLEGFPAKHLARRREVEILMPKTFGLKCSG
jgi:hypothetical protein